MLENPKDSPASKIVPGPAHLRHYPAHHLVAWQPHRVLDDRLLDEIAEWLCIIEKAAVPFNRLCFAKTGSVLASPDYSRHSWEIRRFRRVLLSTTTTSCKNKLCAATAIRVELLDALFENRAAFLLFVFHRPKVQWQNYGGLRSIGSGIARDRKL
jgi:hypothetical protein